MKRLKLLYIALMGASCCLPLQGGSAETMSGGAKAPAAVGETSALPLSRKALFDLAPGAGKGQGAAALPSSRDDLFGIEDRPSGPAAPDPPISRESLFGIEAGTDRAKALPDLEGVPRGGGQGDTKGLQGLLRTRLAYTYGRPDHWSKLAASLQLAGRGGLGGGVRWKLSGRADYDAVYDLTEHYQSAVRRDQRMEFQLRETYLDLPAGDWEWRIGRQHVVWGEMVGLFFADVVSAKDLREFVLQDFESLRIPQWAVRGEYFGDDWHAELLWIPYPSYDKLGRPADFGQPGRGADFYPYPASPPGIPVIRGEVKPARTLAHTNYGVRVSRLIEGWDMSGFFYSSMNSAPTLYRDPVVPSVPQTYTFTPRHDRIRQVGGTLAKDLADFVLKAEVIYTQGRRYNVVNATDSDGVVMQDNLDWVVGLDMNPDADTRLNVQVFQRVFFDHHPDIVPDRFENGLSLLVNRKLSGAWEAEALLIHSLNRSDWLLRAKANWKARPNLRLGVGLDAFGGPPTGLFGQYDRQDRVYADVRYDF